MGQIGLGCVGLPISFLKKNGIQNLLGQNNGNRLEKVPKKSLRDNCLFGPEIKFVCLFGPNFFEVVYLAPK